MRILAVDDDPSILEVLDAALSALEGHEVTTAYSGQQALRILDGDSERFDCLLLDIQMPDMNGVELCRGVRSRSAYARVPILMLTAMSQRSYIADAFAAGASDYITKPFDLIDLRTRLASALRDRRLAERAGDKRGDADSPLEMRGVSRTLGHSEYENCVMQIAQSAGTRSSVFAIKIGGIDAHYAAMDGERFQTMINHVGKVISKLTRQVGHVISYRGHGVFLCIRIGRNEVMPASFEAVLNRQIQAGEGALGLGRPVRVVVGDMQVLHSGSRTLALETLTRAISSVEQKCLRIEPEPSMSRRVLSNETRGDEARLSDRNAYNQMLGDVLSGELDSPSPLRRAN